MKKIPTNQEWKEYLSEKMNERQWALYQLLEQNAKQGNKPLTQKQICLYLLPEYYGEFYKMRLNTTDRCTKLWDDCQFINDHLEVDHIIIVERYTYRLGTEEDCIRYSDNYARDIITAARRKASIDAKISQDGQMKLLSNTDEYHETFIRKDNSNE